MKLGFLTACLPGWSLSQIAEYAQRQGFTALEVAAWPALGDRPFTATHINAEGLTPAKADEVRALAREHGLTLSSLAYYDNNLHPDPDERAAIHQHVHACIDAAAELDVLDQEPRLRAGMVLIRRSCSLGGSSFACSWPARGWNCLAQRCTMRRSFLQ